MIHRPHADINNRRLTVLDECKEPYITFEEKKLIHSIDEGTGAVKYALCKETYQCHPKDLHVHFLCLKCQHTFCLNDISIPSINLPVNFEFQTIKMVVKGICANCKD